MESKDIKITLATLKEDLKCFVEDCDPTELTPKELKALKKVKYPSSPYEFAKAFATIIKFYEDRLKAWSPLPKANLITQRLGPSGGSFLLPLWTSPSPWAAYADNLGSRLTQIKAQGAYPHFAPFLVWVQMKTSLQQVPGLHKLIGAWAIWAAYADSQVVIPKPQCLWRAAD